MFYRLANAVLPVLMLSGCALTEEMPEGGVNEQRYTYDRTISLTDIAPVVPAYVARPYQKCDREQLLGAKEVIATIESTREERVYVVGGRRCVIPSYR